MVREPHHDTFKMKLYFLNIQKIKNTKLESLNLRTTERSLGQAKQIRNLNVLNNTLLRVCHSEALEPRISDFKFVSYFDILISCFIFFIAKTHHFYASPDHMSDDHRIQNVFRHSIYSPGSNNPPLGNRFRTFVFVFVLVS